MTRTVSFLALFISCCSLACGSITSPTQIQRVWVGTGQSNMRELRVWLNVLAKQRGVKVDGWAEGGDTIENWSSTSSGWLGWVLPALQQPGVEAFIWSQGETDAEVPVLVAAYLPKLIDVIARARVAVGNARLRVIIVEVSMRSDYGSMRNVQKSYVASDPYSRLVFTEDLQDANGHFAPDEYPVIAQRVVKAIDEP